MSSKVLTLDTINPNVIRLEYAVRGPIVARALELEKKLKQGEKLPFEEVVKCNIGDCHATGQKPLTFLRQTMAALACPSLLATDCFPKDVKRKAQRILEGCGGGSVGAYSASTGVEVLRKDIAAYISARDGLPCNYEDVFLSTGASEAVKSILSLLSTTQSGTNRAGVMVPIPQYPLYSATNAEYNACQIDYYLDEENGWSLQEKELERALHEAKDHCKPRAIVVINPGNPTGQILSRVDMEMVIRFAKRNRLVILADEVYQQNVYHPETHPWFSFKSVLASLAPELRDEVELVSVMSASKGYMGECGFRGGFAELVNFDKDVKAQLYKLLSARLCPSVMGQAMIGTICNPPKQGDDSFQVFIKERDEVLGGLKRKAKMTSDTLNSLTGVKCNTVRGAMYAFPKIDIPQKAIEKARELGVAPDFMYCLQLLEQKGICVVPGSGFGQKPGTFHFRITILPSEEKMTKVMQDLQEFHEQFLTEYN